MIKPEQIKAYDDLAAYILNPIRDEVLKDISRRIAKAGKITDTAEYQIYRATALRASKDMLNAVVRKNKKSIIDEVNQIFEGAAEAAHEGSGSIQQTVDAYKAIASSSLISLLTQNMGMPVSSGKVIPMQDAYRVTMDYAFRQIVTGATDYTTALRRATKELAERGIREVPRKNGRSVSIEHAARNYIMNQLGLMNREIQNKNHNELEHDGWEISAHRGSAPDHEPIQGRQYPDDVYQKLNGRFDGNYKPDDPDVLERPIGLLGCRHWAFSIKLGVNSPQYTPEQLQELIDDNAKGITYNGSHYTRYQAEQEQASLEGQIRNIKSKCLLYEGLGDSAKLRTERIKLSRYREEYARFSKAAKLPLRNERLQLAGFGRKEAAQARVAFNAQHSNRVYQINVSGEVSPKDRDWIEKELSMIPENHKKYIETQISSISVVKNADRSTYQRRTKEIKLSDTAPQGAVIHECAHALEKALDIYNDPKFVKVRENGLKSLSKQDIIEDDDTFSQFVYRIDSAKFVSKYQGVLSEAVGIVDKDKVVIEALTEYFAEGYSEYLVNPKHLKEVDQLLFDYLEGIV